MISTFENRWIVFSDGGKIELKDFFYNHYAGFSVFANRFIPDRSACEDIVQDVFLAFWERPRTFRNLLSLKAFFYTSIRNICLDEIKHLKVEQKYFELNREELAAGTYLDEIVKIEAYNEVYREINRLPEMERKVLLLALDGRPNEEIADYLHISVNTVRTHKARAYKVLRKKLGGVFLVFMSLRKRDSLSE
ncbi:MAG: sigma-70 family RNA polymerase sigma factor [Prolixibacteraceae bacterium]